MIIKTIIDKDNGRKWEIIKKDEDAYTYNYYEYFRGLGWKGYNNDNREVYSKAAIEAEFGITL